MMKICRKSRCLVDRSFRRGNSSEKKEKRKTQYRTMVQKYRPVCKDIYAVNVSKKENRKKTRFNSTHFCSSDRTKAKLLDR